MPQQQAILDVGRASNELTRLVHHVNNATGEKALRKFAVWCTRQMDAPWKPEVYTMMKLAEDAIAGEADRRELQSMYDDMEGAAIAAESVEVYSQETYAPVLLASRGCINPDAERGALDASENLHQYWRIILQYEITDLGDDDKQTVIENRIQTMRQYEIDQLLDLLTDRPSTN